MKKILLAVCASFAISALTLVNNANAQSKPARSIDVISKAVPKSRGVNPNIKQGAPTVDKPEAKSRGGEPCLIKFDNFTGLTVDIMVDGRYKATVAPYSDSTVKVGGGYTTMYCISAGKTKEWSHKGDCNGLITFNIKDSTAD